MTPKFSNNSFFFVAVITLLFCLAIALDVTPFLRGPAPYPPEWQWDYLFINTLNRIYAPLLCITIIIGLFLSQESRNKFAKRLPLLLLLLIFLDFLFQLSILFLVDLVFLFLFIASSIPN